MSQPTTKPSRPIRLLLSDVDGTLVTQEKVLTERARQAVKKLNAAGIAFAITSGRPPRGMGMLIKPLEVTTPVAAFNGGLLVTPDLTTTIEEKLLPADLVESIIATISSQGLDVWVYRGAEWFVRDAAGPHVDREQRTVRFAATVVDSFASFRDKIVKIVGVSDDLDAVERTESLARKSFGDHVSAARSQPYYLDVTHPQANKGQVLLSLSRRLGIEPSEIATMGDMPNDVLMFAHSGLSIAMGNASSEVQRAARHVTTSNEDEGFANAVDRYILNTAGPSGAAPAGAS